MAGAWIVRKWAMTGETWVGEEGRFLIGNIQEFAFYL